MFRFNFKKPLTNKSIYAAYSNIERVFFINYYGRKQPVTLRFKNLR
jgi:hypothetical protein